jgi:tetratricopeptide (TPR) repeat protein
MPNIDEHCRIRGSSRGAAGLGCPRKSNGDGWAAMAHDVDRQGPAPYALDIAAARTLSDLAGLLRSLRRRHARTNRDSELTYRELAARTGWSVTAIAEYFTARTLPPTDRFDALVGLLGATRSEQGALATARDRVAERRRGVPAEPSVPNTPEAPKQLPPDVPAFTGRRTELAALDALLTPASAAVGVVSGMAGVGKTALAVHWAHRVADRFEGHLYVDLRGFDPGGQAMDPGEAVRLCLEALGVPIPRIPAQADACTALYRSLLAGRRMLVLLDNARNAAQVRPLLPGVPSCVTVATSRNRLTGLVATAGAKPVGLHPLAGDEAWEVLTGRIGADRVSAEPDAVEEIVGRCARLPLALVIVAARAATRPSLPLRVLADELGDSRRRLDGLAADDDPHTDVRAVLSWSYRALTRPAARLFRLLGWFPGPTTSAPAVAAMAALPAAEAERSLGALAAAHILETLPGERFRFHDLLGTYAGELALHAEPAAERDAAAGRLLGWYLHATSAAAQLLEPGRRRLAGLPEPSPQWQVPISTRTDALAWFDAEQPGAIARARLAAETGHHELGWQLFTESGGYFLLRKSRTERISHGLLALRSARRAGHRYGEGSVLNSLGLAFGDADRRRALFSYRRALRIRHDIGDLEGEASTLNNLGPLYWDLQRFEEALRCLRRALVIARQTGNQHSEIVALNNLGEAYGRLGRSGEALDVQQQALGLARLLSHGISEGFALNNLGGIHRGLGRLDDAREFFTAALAVRRRNGDRYGEADTLVELGVLWQDAGRVDAALESWRQALAIFEDLGARETIETRRRIEQASSATDMR